METIFLVTSIGSGRGRCAAHVPSVEFFGGFRAFNAFFSFFFVAGGVVVVTVVVVSPL